MEKISDIDRTLKNKHASHALLLEFTHIAKLLKNSGKNLDNIYLVPVETPRKRGDTD